MSPGGAPDVAVVGAGIVGAACALFLARSGARVALFERAFPAAGSTGAGEGNVLTWDKELHRELPLALRSAALWEALADGLSPDIEYDRKGSIVVAETEAELAAATERAAVLAQHGVRCSALSADAHEGADQMTLEARNYGLARHYHPFLVNTVVGFIGPEYLYDARQITRAGLEDHFMGKLHGISMGCDACYTNHADADQNDLENLEVLLTTAGCNFFMGLPMGDDVMLNYQSTSFHDGAAMRQLFGFRPAPEFEAWLEEMGIMRDGKLTPRAGDPTLFS